MKLKLGLIGLSSDWKTRHLPALRLLADRFEVRSVYNCVGSLANSIANEFDAQAFYGFREMLADEETEAVLFLGPGWYGTAPISAACDFGKAIYCGSEIKVAPSRAAKLRQVVESSGVAFMAEFPRRLAPASLRLKELIATRLGQPEMIFCHRREVQSDCPQMQRQRMDREMLELLDWCSFIAARPIGSLQSFAHSPRPDQSPHYFSVTAELTNQSVEGTTSSQNPAETTVAQISYGTYIPQEWKEAANFKTPAAMQVKCQHGLAYVDLPSTLIWFDEAGRHQESLDSEPNVGQQLLTQFHRSVTSLVRKMADLEDIYQGLIAIQTAEQSRLAKRRLSMPLS